MIITESFTELQMVKMSQSKALRLLKDGKSIRERFGRKSFRIVSFVSATLIRQYFTVTGLCIQLSTVCILEMSI